MRYLVLLLIIIPAIEITLFIYSGELIGLWPTLLLIIFTGVMGAYFAKRQGLEVLKQAQLQMSRGQLPGNAILDGICIFAGGILLLTPGFLTDLIGLLLLLPLTRKFVKLFMITRLKKWIEKGNITIIR